MKSAPKLTFYRMVTLIGLILLALTLTGAAMAAETEPIDVTVSVTPETLAAPGEVTVSVRVTNIQSQDMTEAVSLYAPDGKLVTVFGDGGSVVLKAGEFRTVQITWQVTAEQLAKGELAYTAKYGEKSVVGSAKITKTDADAALQVTRTLSPEVVRNGDKASVIYELYNAGTVDLTTIKVTEEIASKSPQTISTLKAGDKKTLTFTAKMGTKDLTSSAKITYKVKGESKTETLNVQNLVIPAAVRGLNITLTTDKDAVNIGETVKLILNIENKGNITYSDVSVTDGKLGEVFSGLTIPAGAVMKEEKEVTVTEPSKYTLSVKLNDNTGNTTTLNTNAVSVSAYDPAKELKLTLLLTSDTDSINQIPAPATMTLVVTNTSNIDCKNIKIKQSSADIYTIPSLKAGESVTLRRDYTLSQAGQFRFTATADDAIGNTVSFESNTLNITYTAPTSAPTIAPEITVAPLVTVAPATYDDVDNTLRVTRNTLYTATYVLGILFAAALVLFLISSIIRVNKKRVSSQAYDHLELGDKRDYTEPAAEEEQAEMPDITQSSEEQPVEFISHGAPAAEEALPHEKLMLEAEDDEPHFDIPDPVPPEMLIKPSQEEADDEPSKEEADERPLVSAESDGMGAYRMKRDDPANDQASGSRKKRRAVKRTQNNVSDGEE